MITGRGALKSVLLSASLVLAGLVLNPSQSSKVLLPIFALQRERGDRGPRERESKGASEREPRERHGKKSTDARESTKRESSSRETSSPATGISQMIPFGDPAAAKPKAVKIADGVFKVDVDFPAANMRGEGQLVVRKDELFLSQGGKVLVGRQTGRSERGDTSLTFAFRNLQQGPGDPSVLVLSVRAEDELNRYLFPGDLLDSLKAAQGEKNAFFLKFTGSEQSRPGITSTEGTPGGGTPPPVTPPPPPPPTPTPPPPARE